MLRLLSHLWAHACFGVGSGFWVKRRSPIYWAGRLNCSQVRQDCRNDIKCYESSGSECIIRICPSVSPHSLPLMRHIWSARAPLMTSVTNEAAGRSGPRPSLERVSRRAGEPERSQPDENAEQVTSCCTLVVAPSLAYLAHVPLCVPCLV